MVIYNKNVHCTSLQSVCSCTLDGSILAGVLTSSFCIVPESPHSSNIKSSSLSVAWSSISSIQACQQWYGRYDHGCTGFWGRKNGDTWILTCVCAIEWPLQVVRRSLGRLNYGKVFFNFFKSSSIQGSDERIEVSQFSMTIFQCETSVQIGEGLTCTSCEAVISGSSVQSL